MWTDKGVTLGVVVASKGYPLDYERGVELPDIEGDVITYYAGAKFAENSRALLSNGGRVYMLVYHSRYRQRSPSQHLPRTIPTKKIEGLFYRTDIGSKAIK